MKFVGAPDALLKKNVAQVADLYAYGDCSVPRIDGLPIGAFVVQFEQRSDGNFARQAMFPTEQIGCAHWPAITHIQPLYEVTPWVVSDSKGVKPGERIPVIGCFVTHGEAAEYIGTLPEYETGRYNLDGPGGR